MNLCNPKEILDSFISTLVMNCEDRKTTFGDGIRKYNIDDPSNTIVTDSRQFLIINDIKNKTSVRRQIGNALPAAVSKAFFLEL